MTDAIAGRAGKPVLKLKYLSHGTLESLDLDRSRRFYEEFLGLDVVRTSNRSLMIRLGGTNTIAVVFNPNKKAMPMLNHNGLDVATRPEVDECYRRIGAAQQDWGIKKLTRPSDQHGSYAFYFTDPDDNWWEILANPEGGYSWMFDKGGDIAEWGAGEAKGFNPNQFTSKRLAGRDDGPDHDDP